MISCLWPTTALALLAWTGGARAESPSLEEVQAAIRDRGLRWSAAETSLSRLPPELRPGGGALPPLEPEGAVAPPPPGSLGFAEQEYFDWRDQGGDFTTRVRNQGVCGSCWAFAALAAMETQYNIAAGDPEWDPDLSEQVVLSCSDGACEGGWWLEDTFDFLLDNGAAEESCLRYEDSDEVPCEDACQDYQDDPWELRSWDRCDASTGAIKAQLQHGPVATWMELFEDIYHYAGGVYEPSSQVSYGGHFVLITGWDDAVGAWICKNSWGNGWGENTYESGREAGFFRIAYGASGIQRYDPFYAVVPPCDCPDADGDGWQDADCTRRACLEALDCDDSDPEVNPDAEEICFDGKDNDCDGVMDIDHAPCQPEVPRGGPPVRGSRGCGCGSAGSSAPLWGLLGLLGLARRRGAHRSPGPKTPLRHRRR